MNVEQEMQLREYYRHYLEMFESQGWKQYVADIQVAVQNLEKVNWKNVTTENDLGKLQGRVQVLESQLVFADSIKAAVAELDNPDDGTNHLED